MYQSKGLPDGDEIAKFRHPLDTLNTKLVDELSDLAEGFMSSTVWRVHFQLCQGYNC